MSAVYLDGTDLATSRCFQGSLINLTHRRSSQYGETATAGPIFWSNHAHTMLQERLNATMVLHIHKDLTDLLDLKAVGNDNQERAQKN